MKNQWVTVFLGYVKVRLKGRGSERFVNECVRRGIFVWNVKRIGNEALTFHMLLKDVRRLRGVRRKNECDIAFIGRYGFPFWQKRLLRNSGFLIGFVLFFVSIIVLSNMVWNVEIEGAKPETEYLLVKELNHLGVEKGKLQFQMPDVDAIQRSLTNNVHSITWVGVELRGTTYHLQVVEKSEPEEEEALSPRNLIAKKEAVIERLFVEKGKPAVAVHDHVEKGQLLVSGMYGKEDNPTLVPAKGVIFGETWYKSEVEVPLKTTFQVYTGEFFVKHYIKLGNFKIKVWGFEENKYKRFKEDAMMYNIKFFRWSLPIAYEKVSVREEEAADRQYTEKQAIEAGKEMAQQELKKKLDEKATIVGEKVLQKRLENGKLKLSLHYKVIEDIVATQPISKPDIQKESKKKQKSS
ncbi:sporulation protein YqfD [Ectobacillus funiculus]|uniref:Sporulation protein YqfD n=1 Tax=Ectobacillus funiculus TaxID=137993 RepID=A0ABV5WME6_9BACI